MSGTLDGVPWLQLQWKIEEEKKIQKNKKKMSKTSSPMKTNINFENGSLFSYFCSRRNQGQDIKKKTPNKLP